MTRRTDEVFSALADPTRRRVLSHISAMGSATATELAEGLPVTRQAIVKHLNALGSAGLVSSERFGREVRYQVTAAPLVDAMGWMTSVGARWDDRLERLREEFG